MNPHKESEPQEMKPTYEELLATCKKFMMYDYTSMINLKKYVRYNDEYILTTIVDSGVISKILEILTVSDDETLNRDLIVFLVNCTSKENGNYIKNYLKGIGVMKLIDSKLKGGNKELINMSINLLQNLISNEGVMFLDELEEYDMYTTLFTLSNE